jgi:hypothetical protein
MESLPSVRPPARDESCQSFECVWRPFLLVPRTSRWVLGLAQVRHGAELRVRHRISTITDSATFSQRHNPSGISRSKHPSLCPEDLFCELITAWGYLNGRNRLRLVRAGDGLLPAV